MRMLKIFFAVIVFALAGMTVAGEISTFDGKQGADEIAQGWQKNKFLGQGQTELVSDDKGGLSLKLTNDMNVTKKVMQVYACTNSPVAAGEKLKVSLRMKGKGGYTAGLYCYTKKSGPYIGCQVKELFPGYLTIDSADWESHSFEFTVPAETFGGLEIDMVRVFFSIGSGEITIDDVEFTRIKPEIKPDIVLKNDNTEIAFASAKDGFSCLKIADVKNKTRFVFPELSAQSSGLWRLNFVKSGQPDKPALTNLSPATAAGSSQKLADGTEQLTLTWKNMALAEEKNAVDVTATVLLKPDGESEWRIDVQNKSSRYGLRDVEFPVFLTIAAPGTADVVFPGGVLGGILREKNRNSGFFVYPTESWALHFMSFVTGNKGLYIGLHDPRQRPSEANLSDGQDLVFRQFPDNMAQPGTGYKSDFPVVVKLHDGDWWKAVKIYRQWVTTLPRWYNKPLSERNLPAAFMDAGIWMCMWQSPKAVAEIVVNAEKYFQVPAGIFWCEWGQHKFDRNLPEFFPFRPNMVESVKKMEENGTAVMPYTNALCWAKDNKEFTSEPVQNGLVMDYSGNPKIQNYGAGIGVMCPAYPMWREKILEINRKLIGEAGINTVYWDQVGASFPLHCFAKNHNHPAGWNHWVADYNSLLVQTRKDIIGNKQVALTTESGPDAYDFDGMLNCWWNNSYNSQNAIPLTAAALCDRVRYLAITPDKIQTFQAYVMIQGRFFLWGMPSPVHHREFEQNNFPCSDVERSKAHETLKQMVRCRLAAKKFMVYGELMGELKPSNVLPSVSAVFDCITVKDTVTFPAVRASIWKHADGDLGIGIINFSGSAQTFSFKLDTAQYSDQKTVKWQIVELRADGEKSGGESSSEVSRTEQMEPYSAKFLALRQIK